MSETLPKGPQTMPTQEESVSASSWIKHNLSKIQGGLRTAVMAAALTFGATSCDDSDYTEPDAEVTDSGSQDQNAETTEDTGQEISEDTDSETTTNDADASKALFGDPCNSDSDCESGACWDKNTNDATPGFCSTECPEGDASVCPDGAYCDESGEPFGFGSWCTPEGGGFGKSCEGVADCLDPEHVCHDISAAEGVQGLCTVLCDPEADPSDCPDGSVCEDQWAPVGIDAYCRPTGGQLGEECQEGLPCEDPFICVDRNPTDNRLGACTESCATDTDCPEGSSCDTQGVPYGIPAHCLVETQGGYGSECETDEDCIDEGLLCWDKNPSDEIAAICSITCGPSSEPEGRVCPDDSLCNLTGTDFGLDAMCEPNN